MPRKNSSEPLQEILPAQEDSVELVTITPQSAELVLTNKDEFEKLYAKVKAATEALEPDVSTAKGRDAIRSMARKVVTTKTAIDKARLALTKDWRDKVSAANEQGKEIEQKLTELADEVRRPLTEYEEAEKAREQRKQDFMSALVAERQIAWDDDSAAIATRATTIKAMVINPDDWGDDIEAIQARVAEALDTLRAAYSKAKQAEDAAAELERLRAEEEQRKADEAAKIEAERVAKEAEETRAAAEKAEAERLARIQQEAADKAKRDAEEVAEAERQRIQKEHDDAIAAERAKADEEARAKQVEIDAANARAAEIERQAQIQRETVEKERAATEAKAAAEAEEQRKRDEDKAHRIAVMTAMKEALMEHADMDEAAAKRAVLALTGKHIPNTEVRF